MWKPTKRERGVKITKVAKRKLTAEIKAESEKLKGDLNKYFRIGNADKEQDEKNDKDKNNNKDENESNVKMKKKETAKMKNKVTTKM